MLQSQEAQATGIESLRSDEFYNPAYASIFEAMCRLYQKSEPIDSITLGNELKEMRQYDAVGGAAGIGKLIDYLPDFSNVATYCTIVHEKAVSRRLIEVAREIIEEAHTTDLDAQVLLDLAEGRIFGVSTDLRRTSIVSVRELVGPALSGIRERMASDDKVFGIKSGIPRLDSLTSGFKKGNLSIIAGRPSMGKTSLAINIAQQAAVTHGHKCLVFSLEMSDEELLLRMLANQAKINLKDLTDGNLTDGEFGRTKEAADLLSQAPIFIDDQPFTNPLEVRAKARRIAKENGGLDLIMVDYLQLMSGGDSIGGTREQEISGISRFLKGLAKELEIPVIALSQLSRQCETRENKRPILSDLRESGAIEQDADLVVFVYREEIYTGPFTSDGKDVDGEAELIVAKHRNGPTGLITLRFHKEYTTFGEI